MASPPCGFVTNGRSRFQVENNGTDEMAAVLCIRWSLDLRTHSVDFTYSVIKSYQGESVSEIPGEYFVS